jgi:hypothetical protein
VDAGKHAEPSRRPTATRPDPERVIEADGNQTKVELIGTHPAVRPAQHWPPQLAVRIGANGWIRFADPRGIQDGDR